MPAMFMVNLRGLGTEQVSLYVTVPGYEVSYPATKEIQDYVQRGTESPDQFDLNELAGLLQPVKGDARAKAMVDEVGPWGPQSRMTAW